MAGHKSIYRYEETENSEQWIPVIRVDIRVTCMISYKDYIYCTQNYFNELYRFEPNVDNELKLATCFNNLPSGLCILGMYDCD